MTFIIVDGLDGVGKGVVIDSILDYFKSQGKKVFDVHEYWEKNHKHPSIKDFEGCDVLSTSEPTYVGVGNSIRFELIQKENNYSTEMIAQAYAMDRMVLYKKVILPALEKGLIIVQSRGVSTSIVYQALQGGMTREEIMNLEGNKFTLENVPDVLIIPTIQNPEEVIKRLKRRDKDDNAIFENLDFQMKLKPLYESKEFQDIFITKGTKVFMLDAGISVEETRKQAINIVKVL